jgi:hypothetical protein
MPNLRLEGTRIKYAHKRHVKDFEARLKELLKEATREFLKEVIKDFPVYTGMSLASLRPLGKFLNVPIKISPDPDARKQENKWSKYRPRKTIAKGERAGTYRFKVTNGLIDFNIRSDVLQYRINEFIDATQYRHPEKGFQYFRLKQPGPYYSFERGKAAYYAFVKRQLPKKLPKITDYFTKASITAIRD